MTSQPPPSLNDQLRILRRSGHLQPRWYRRVHPDVALLGMDPAEHYLRYGAALGRDPGRGFSTALYLGAYPEVAGSGWNPLAHYESVGRVQGYVCQSSHGGARARQDVARIRYRLLNLGITDRALADLEALAETHPHAEGRAAANHELALWHMRQDSAGDYRAALRYVARARRDAVMAEPRARLATVELLCHHFLSERAEGLAAWSRAAEAGDADADVLLARANLDPAPEGRLRHINLVLDHFVIPRIALQPGEGDPYDRLTSAGPVAPAAGEGPLVSVLMASYNAADVLPTALRSLQEQSWRNLEILVLDDRSTDDTARVVREIAARDPRIRLVEMERNGGAYVARNRGLDLARGDYVTLHDADDWSHPLKIETQLRQLEAAPHMLGCMSQQARATPDLQFVRWAGKGRFLIENVSSFMFRREPMREHFGYWDSVRFSADNELIERMRARFGNAAVRVLPTGPLSFQREGETSAISDAALGVKGFKFGVRREYLDALRAHHARSEEHRYEADPARRAFAVPAIMRPERAQLGETLRHRDVILAGDLRVADCAAAIADLGRDHSLGLVEIFDYDAETGEGVASRILDPVRERIDGGHVRLVAFGETASCDLLVVLGLGVLRDRQRYVPEVEARRIAILADEMPGDPHIWGENLRHYFGTAPAVIYPATTRIRTALKALDLPERLSLAEKDVCLEDLGRLVRGSETGDNR